MSKGKSTTTTTTDPTQMAIYQDLYDKSKSIASQPFVPYTGARVAGFNPDQLQGFDATRNMFGQSMSFDPRQKLNTLANQQTPTVTPFTGSATQLQPAAMQQGVNLGSAAMQQAANIAPVERFGGANISPVDLYSGASVNRGDVRDVKPQSLLSTDLGAYQNPFQSQVIDNTLDDLNRARQLQIQSDQDAAIGRGAFGGSRSALLESETNRNFADSVAKASGNLRSQGFDRATSLAGQDIGRQFDADRYMSGVDSNVAMQNATFGQQAGLARQGLLGDVAQNQARLNQQTGMASMDAFNRAAQQQAQLNANRFSADQDAANRFALQQGSMDANRFSADQSALNQFGLQQGSYNNAMNMANMDAQNRARFMQPGLEMQNRQFRAGLLGNQLSDQYRNLGLLSGIGSQQQGLQQAGMDAGYNEFLRAIGYGPQQLGLLAQGVSALPTQTNQSNSYKPGMGDYLGGAASLLGSAAMGGGFGKDGFFTNLFKG